MCEVKQLIMFQDAKTHAQRDEMNRTKTLCLSHTLGAGIKMINTEHRETEKKT